ncbi:unnamed protein product, partial [Didymodactylos carnosus]
QERKYGKVIVRNDIRSYRKGRGPPYVTMGNTNRWRKTSLSDSSSSSTFYRPTHRTGYSPSGSFRYILPFDSERTGKSINNTMNKKTIQATRDVPINPIYTSYHESL